MSGSAARVSCSGACASGCASVSGPEGACASASLGCGASPSPSASASRWYCDDDDAAPSCAPSCGAAGAPVAPQGRPASSGRLSSRSCIGGEWTIDGGCWGQGSSKKEVAGQCSRCIGLALCLGNAPNDAGQKQVQWFARSSKTFCWPGNPKFRIAYPGLCPVESFLLHITDEMLTPTGLTNKTKEPRFNAPFMKRLRLFCQAKGLTRTRGATAAAASDNEEDSDDEEAEDRSCDDEEAGTPHSSRRHVPHLPTRTHAHAHTHTHIAYAKLA